MTSKTQTMGKYLQAKRKQANLTQQEVATALGWNTSQFVSNIERDASPIPAKKIHKIAKILKADIDTLIEYHVASYTESYTKKIKGYK